MYRRLPEEEDMHDVLKQVKSAPEKKPERYDISPKPAGKSKK
jgi:hypothetical protein